VQLLSNLIILSSVSAVALVCYEASTLTENIKVGPRLFHNIKEYHQVVVGDSLLLVTKEGCPLFLQCTRSWCHILVDSMFVAHALYGQEQDSGTCVALP
jgi:hypothetical protein